jgi:hypothetical protein
MPNRVLVCGSRNWTNQKFIYEKLQEYARHTIIEGGAEGADLIAKDCARLLELYCEEYPADWHKYGRAAGCIRNQQMLVEGKPDLVMAFFMPGSKGTTDMVRRAIEVGIPVKLYGAIPTEFKGHTECQI